MKNKYLIATALLIITFTNCSTPKYINDQSSYIRQKELYEERGTNTALNIVSCVGLSLLGAAIDTEIEIPTYQEFKKLKLINPTNDTLYVNMLTDLIWDKNNYCDFMDIRIPPQMNCKIMVPLEANYNVYFSNTPESDDDEMIQIYTTNTKRIELIPGMTFTPNSF